MKVRLNDAGDWSSQGVMNIEYRFQNIRHLAPWCLDLFQHYLILHRHPGVDTGFAVAAFVIAPGPCVVIVVIVGRMSLLEAVHAFICMIDSAIGIVNDFEIYFGCVCRSIGLLLW